MKNYTFTLFNLKCCVSALDKRCARNIIISEIMANKQLYINNYNAIYRDYNKKEGLKPLDAEVSSAVKSNDSALLMLPEENQNKKGGGMGEPKVPPEEELFDFLVTYIDETNILEE